VKERLSRIWKMWQCNSYFCRRTCYQWRHCVRCFI